MFYWFCTYHKRFSSVNLASAAWVIMKTRKRGNCECIATWRPPDVAPVSIHFNYDAHAKFKVAQAIHCRLIAFLLLIRYVMLWPWPLTPWPWTFVVDWVSSGETLYQIWAKSNNPRLSYWSFSNFCTFSPSPRKIRGWVGGTSDSTFQDHKDTTCDTLLVWSVVQTRRFDTVSMPVIPAENNEPQVLRVGERANTNLEGREDCHRNRFRILDSLLHFETTALQSPKWDQILKYCSPCKN